MMYVIAVDPGLTCGWAIAEMHDTWEPSKIMAGQSPSDDFCDWAHDAIASNTLLLVERFTVTASTARKSSQPEPMEVIGVLKFLARRAGAQLELQSPSAAKRFAPDAQLKRVGLWKPGMDHARDAIRHLMLGIATYGTGQAREEMLQSLA